MKTTLNKETMRLLKLQALVDELRQRGTSKFEIEKLIGIKLSNFPRLVKSGYRVSESERSNRMVFIMEEGN